MSPRVLRAYHRTETLHPKGFVARVEIVGIIRHLRDDTWVYDTKDEARKREAELLKNGSMTTTKPTRLLNFVIRTPHFST